VVEADPYVAKARQYLTAAQRAFKELQIVGGKTKLQDAIMAQFKMTASLALAINCLANWIESQGRTKERR
jgi:hypothetical protein